MALFLYDEENAPQSLAEGNAGLWYNKFFNQWKTLDKVDIPEDGKIDWINKNGKLSWIKAVAGKNVGNSDAINDYVHRLGDLLAAHEQEPLFYKLESDFVTGLGLEHPIENGFAWHHTLGTPYLPASSVKGLVRAWAEHWENEVSDDDFTRIFGSPKNSKANDASQIGSVIFLDAVPYRPIKLKADIMTPHYGNYYQDATGNTPPADWLTPTPIPFLVVEKGQTFLFGVLPRSSEDAALCETVKEWLTEALTWLGAGAKTAVGYGRFAEDTDTSQKYQTDKQAAKQAIIDKIREEEKEAKIAEERAAMSEIRREMDEDGYRSTNFIGKGMQKWLERMDAAEPAEKCEIATYLKEWYEDIFAKSGRKLKSPKNKNKLTQINEALEACQDNAN